MFERASIALRELALLMVAVAGLGSGLIVMAAGRPDVALYLWWVGTIPVVIVLVFTAIGVVLWIGGHDAIAGRISAGDLSEAHHVRLAHQDEHLNLLGRLLGDCRERSQGDSGEDDADNCDRHVSLHGDDLSQGFGTRTGLAIALTRNSY